MDMSLQDNWMCMITQISDLINLYSASHLAYIYGYGCQHCLVNLFEDLKSALDQSKLAAVLSVGVSKVFACPHMFQWQTH